MDRNGNITGYKVQYGTTSFDNTITIHGTSTENRSLNATDLDPLTTYMFRVAAINVDGTGPYSTAESFNSEFGHSTSSFECQYWCSILFSSLTDGDSCWQ